MSDRRHSFSHAPAQHRSKGVCAFERNRGFTLIEIMAVVMLIALIASSSIVLFSPGGPQKDLDDALEQFVEVSHQVHDLSILTGEAVGLLIVPPAWSGMPIDKTGWSYSWRRYVEVPDENGNSQPQWVPIDGVNSVSISIDIDLYIHIEDSEWEWQSVPKNEQPLFVLFPTGEAEPFLFEVEFAPRDLDIDPQHVKFDVTGRLQWVEAQAALEKFKEQQR